MAVNPEHIGDVEEGTPKSAPEVDELGLTPEERAAFDGMKEADAGAPTDPEPEPAPEPAPAPAPAPGAPPAPPPGPAPAPVAADADDDDEPDLIVNNPKTGKAQKTVSVGKHNRLLTKAQQAAQQIQQQLETERAERIRLNERLAILNEALTAAPPPAPVDPAEAQRRAVAENPMLEQDIDPNEDALGAIAQANRRIAFMANQVQQSHETTTEQLNDQTLLQTFQRDTQAFTQTEEGRHFMGPDGAYQFLKNSRLQELAISLFDKDPTDPNEQFTQQEINRLISDFNAEEKWVVQNAINSKKSPSAAILKLARSRGWKPPAAAPAPAPAAAPPAAPAPRAAPAPAPAAPAPAPAAAAPAAAPAPVVARMQNEIEAAAASRSLSDGGGAPPPMALDADRLLKMSDEEFGRYVDSLPKEQLDAIMGREQERPRY